MPNWCDNKVTVQATKKDHIDELLTFVNRVREAADDKELHLLDAFVPMPDKYKDTVAVAPRQEADDGLTWYDWQQANWGCKWGDCDGGMTVGDDRAVLEFATPSEPPLAGLQAISRQFPNLAFTDRWCEESPSRGRFIVKGGEVSEWLWLATSNEKGPNTP